MNTPSLGEGHDQGEHYEQNSVPKTSHESVDDTTFLDITQSMRDAILKASEVEPVSPGGLEVNDMFVDEIARRKDADRMS